MYPEKFRLLLSWVAPLIWKFSMRCASAIPPERFYVILKYFAVGDAQFTIVLSYRTSLSIMREKVCVLWDVLYSKGYMNAPVSKEE